MLFIKQGIWLWRSTTYCDRTINRNIYIAYKMLGVSTSSFACYLSNSFRAWLATKAQILWHGSVWACWQVNFRSSPVLDWPQWKFLFSCSLKARTAIFLLPSAKILGELGSCITDLRSGSFCRNSWEGHVSVLYITLLTFVSWSVVTKCHVATSSPTALRLGVATWEIEAGNQVSVAGISLKPAGDVFVWFAFAGCEGLHLTLGNVVPPASVMWRTWWWQSEVSNKCNCPEAKFNKMSRRVL